ncbi:MAG: hypothetical protein R3311_20615, partial [Oceanisphaera sp.]|nr:hypothetical protein [Oceanisphaera sp.]
MISKPKLALAIALATGSWNALSGPLADAVNALGLGSLLTDTTTTLTDGLGSALSTLGGSSLADADIISPANGDGALDADVISSSTLLGLQPVDSSMVDPNQTIDTGILFPAGLGGAAVAPLNGALQGLVGSEGVITGIVQTLGDNLQDA